MSPVIARIVLRWVAGFLIAKGLFAPDDAQMFTADPEIERLVISGAGALAGAAAEGWYWLAKRLGWRT